MADRLRLLFVGLWAALLIAKIGLAAWLPPLVDETFYTWEGRHLAWAYSDLPGLTAWLTRLGIELGGLNPLAVRLPFLALGAAVPWLVVGLARRWFDPVHAWLAGLLALAMPLSGSLGMLATPDVPLVLAMLLCLDGIARLRERIDRAGLAVLALGLAMGALSHYRFVLALAAGLAGLLLDPRGRRLLGEPRVWAAIALGALAWLPLMLWNLQYGGAGLRFQFVDRHPWAFHAEGWTWLPSQFLLVTPALFVLLAWTLATAWRRRADPAAPWGLLAGFAAVAVPGYFVMGFFVDSERVSFHWPLAGWLALAVAAPAVLQAWPAWARRAVWGLAGLGLTALLGYHTAAAMPAARHALAGNALYPGYFAGWPELAAELRRLDLPPDTAIVANYLDVGAQLAFNLDRPDVLVLEHAKNQHSGRAAQLRHWRQVYQRQPGATAPVLLVVDQHADKMEHQLAEFHRLCETFGPLPAPTVLNVDHGRKRYLLFRIVGRGDGGCVAPALMYIDRPRGKGSLPARFEVAGWAFKEGVGLSRVEVTLDERVVAEAEYGLPMPHVAAFWKVSTDPNHPKVGFRAQVDASALAPGRHWLGLRLHGADGSVETTGGMPVTLGR